MNNYIHTRIKSRLNRRNGFPSPTGIAGSILTLGALTLSIFSMAFTRQDRTNTIPAEVRAKSQKAAGTFMATLKGVLVQSMAKGIPAAAATCSDTAQTLTKTIASAHGVEMRRISLNARNSQNIPTVQEKVLLLKLDSVRLAGRLTDSTVVWEIIERQGKQYALHIKPIVLNNALCLQCHGKDADIAPETRTVLDKRYPGDKARGYSIGEIRGAVSVMTALVP